MIKNIWLEWSLSIAFCIVSFCNFIFILFNGIYRIKFFPQQDQGEFIITINAAPGSSLEQTNKIAKIVEEKVSKNPDVINILTTIG
jgi:HAE1 family hydrophobic/amphiphilic exporter-1